MRALKHHIAPLLLGLVVAFPTVTLLAACETLSPKQIAFNSWATACQSYATSLVALAPFVADGTIAEGSEGDQTINTAQELVGPLCREGAPLPALEGTRPTELIQDILLRLQGLVPEES